MSKKVKKNKSNTKEFLTKNSVVIIVLCAILISTLLFFNENVDRSLSIIGFLLFWILYGIKNKDFLIASVVTIIFVFPFNLTVSLPFLGDPYVRGVYVNYLSPTLHLLDIFTFLLVISAGFTLLKKIPPRIIYIVTGYFLLRLIISPTMIVLISSVRILLYLAAIFIGINYLRTIKINLNLILKVLFGSLLLQLIIALIQIYSGAGLGLDFIGESKMLVGSLGSSFISTSSGIVLRGYGTFPHPNILAGLAIFSHIFGLYVWSKEKNKILTSIFLILTYLIVFVTFSRTALFLLILLDIVFAFFNARKNIKGFVLPVYLERIMNTFSNGDFGLSDRLELLKVSLLSLKDNWFGGLGVGRYMLSAKEHIVTTGSGLLLLQPVHNIFLLVLVEHGVFGGLLVLGSILYLYVKRIFINKGVLKVVYILLLITLLVLGLTDHYLLTLPQGFFLFIIALLV